MISIVIPLYNKAEMVARTLRSVVGQTCEDYEIIVVDDGSTDGSAEIVESLHIPRLRLVHRENAGVSAARNLGIREAKGEFVAFLDADDEWQPHYLATQLSLAERYPDCDVFATDYVFCNAGGKTSPTIIRRLPFSGEDGCLTNYFEVASCSHPPLWTSTVMVRKSAILTIGGFPEGVKSGEDLLTWARLAARYKIAYSRKPGAVFNCEGYYRFTDKPKRMPDPRDTVGQQLEALAKASRPEHIALYISHWHKMLSSVYLRLGMRKKSIREALYGLKFHPLNYKLYAYILLNFLPKKLRPF